MKKPVDKLINRKELEEIEPYKEDIKTPGLCNTNNHNYQPISNQGYYKSKPDSDSFNNKVVYNTLYCTKCADTKEIVVCRR